MPPSGVGEQFVLYIAMIVGSGYLVLRAIPPSSWVTGVPQTRRRWRQKSSYSEMNNRCSVVRSLRFWKGRSSPGNPALLRRIRWRPADPLSLRFDSRLGETGSKRSIITKHIRDARQAEQDWGAKAIERLLPELRTASSEKKGFSRANLMYARAFADA